MTDPQLISEAVGVAVAVVAGMAAIPGWVLNQPDTVARFTWRFVSMLLLAIGFTAMTEPYYKAWSLGWWFSFAALCYLLAAVRRQYRLMEAARKQQRDEQRRIGDFR